MASMKAFQAFDRGSNPRGRTIFIFTAYILFMSFNRKRAENQKIAKERIEILRDMKKRFPEFSERYEELIRKISKKYRIPQDF